MDRYGYDNLHRDRLSGAQRLGEAALAWVKSRKAEHWIMFLAGLALGAMLG